ncbi:MAG: alpha-1,2-fucosyltransferase [Nitrososphaerales archaeon]
MVTFSALGNLGRFGNQLWQIAATIGYARFYNMPYVLPFWDPAKFFNGNINQSGQHMRFPTVKEKSFSYQRMQKYGDADLFGYFQSIKYWKHCEDEIRALFQPNYSIGQIVNKQSGGISESSCSIHVRRGDYLELKDYHPSLPLSYYTKAIEEVKSDLYIVFSDDIDWCKENIKAEGKEIIYFSSGNDIMDWFVARTCKKHIIANSSWSWWYSFLCEREGKEIYAPAKNLWFGPGYAHNNIDDLYLPEWKLIEA